MAKGVVVVGSLNLDMVVQITSRPETGETVRGESFAMFLGGKGANQAAACARLGATVTMIGRVGDDVFGPMLLEGLAAAGVDVSLVEETPGSSGVALITTDDLAQNAIVVVAGANDRVTIEDVIRRAGVISAAGIVLLQLETPLETVHHAARLAYEAGACVFLDPAPAPVKPLSAELMQSVTWLTPNETEANTLLGDRSKQAPKTTVERLLQAGWHNVILKLGPEGVYLAGEGIDAVHVEGFKVDAVDSTAAGDAFNGAFGTALLRGMDTISAARIGCAVGAISVTKLGAQPSLPTLDEVFRFLDRRDKPLASLFARHFL